jgi:hypothetical protein
MLKKARQWVGCMSARTPFEWSACCFVFFCTIGLSSVFWLVRMSDWIDMTDWQAPQSLPPMKGVQR